MPPDIADLVYAPTTASTRFELRIPRTLTYGTKKEITCADQVPWVLTGSLGNGKGTAATRPTRPAPNRPFDTIPAKLQSTRVVSWNVEFGGILDHPEPFVRILSALAPDVVLLQELEPDQSADDVAAVLRRATDGDWMVHLGPVGGRLRSAIASRLPATTVPSLDAMQRKDSTDRGVRAASLAIDVPGVGRVLMTSLHLKCCGSAHGPEDMTRIAEVLAVKHAVATAHAAQAFDSVILGGDLNLVGSTVPLDLLTLDG